MYEEETVWVVGKKSSNGDNIPVRIRKSEIRYCSGGIYSTYDLCADAIGRLQEQHERIKQRFRTKDGSPITEFEVVFHGRINNDGLSIVPCNLKGPDGDFMVLGLSITFSRWIAHGSMSSYIVELKRIEQQDPIVV